MTAIEITTGIPRIVPRFIQATTLAALLEQVVI
jgi:hypothetical protein